MIPTDKKRCPDDDHMDKLMKQLDFLATDAWAGSAVVVEKEGGDCFGNWRLDCPRDRLSGCPFFQECMEASAGRAEQMPPTCYGSGAHYSSPQFGDVPHHQPCDADYCCYFHDCCDGTVVIEEEGAPVRGHRFSSIIIDDLADFEMWESIKGCVYVTEEVD